MVYVFQFPLPPFIMKYFHFRYIFEIIFPMIFPFILFCKIYLLHYIGANNHISDSLYIRSVYAP